MKHAAAVLWLFATLPASGHADEPYFLDIPVCLDKAAQSGDSRCIYETRDRCEEMRSDGLSVKGRSTCDQDATAVWNKLMNDEFQGALAAMKQVYVDGLKGGLLATAADQLQISQEKWAAFRDAECKFRSYQWGGVSREGGSTCVLSMTAERAIELRQIWSIRE